MRSFRISRVIALVVGCLLIVGNAALARAEDTKNRFGNQGQNDSYGFVINEDSASFGKNFSSLVAVTNSATGLSYKICNSLEDINCSDSNISNISGIALMPPCELNSKFECIEKFALIDKNGRSHSAQFMRLVRSQQFQGNQIAGLPTGSSISLWKIIDQEINKTFAVVVAQQILSKSVNPMKIEITGFKTLIFEYQERSVPEATDQFSRAVITPDGRNSIQSPGPLVKLPFNCIWTENGICGVEQNLNADSKLSINLRVSSTLTGWLQGRLIDPAIELKPISRGLNSLQVTANPADVPTAAASIKIISATQEIKSLYENRNTGAAPGQGVSANVYASNPEAFKFIQAFISQTGDKAFSKSGQWSFGSIYSSQQNPCLRNDKKLIGLVTTNAMAYRADPPEFKDNYLQYQVAGLHLNPDESIFRGYYDLLIDSSAARCLYRFKNTPINASISVTSQDGTKQTAITTLSERNNWIHLSASNFTFSNPTIKIKLSQSKKK